MIILTLEELEDRYIRPRMKAIADKIENCEPLTPIEQKIMALIIYEQYSAATEADLIEFLTGE